MYDTIYADRYITQHMHTRWLRMFLLLTVVLLLVLVFFLCCSRSFSLSLSLSLLLLNYTVLKFWTLFPFFTRSLVSFICQFDSRSLFRVESSTSAFLQSSVCLFVRSLLWLFCYDFHEIRFSGGDLRCQLIYIYIYIYRLQQWLYKLHIGSEAKIKTNERMKWARCYSSDGKSEKI